VVVAKDTPSFIANRVGTFVTLTVLRIMQERSGDQDLLAHPLGISCEAVKTLLHQIEHFEKA
jgi:hypothetical protein